MGVLNLHMNSMEICITYHPYLMDVVFLDGLCMEAMDDLRNIIESNENQTPHPSGPLLSKHAVCLRPLLSLLPNL